MSMLFFQKRATPSLGHSCIPLYAIHINFVIVHNAGSNHQSWVWFPIKKTTSSFKTTCRILTAHGFPRAPQLQAKVIIRLGGLVHNLRLFSGIDINVQFPHFAVVSLIHMYIVYTLLAQAFHCFV